MSFLIIAAGIIIGLSLYALISNIIEANKRKNRGNVVEYTIYLLEDYSKVTFESGYKDIYISLIVRNFTH